MEASNDDTLEVARTVRDEPPAHYSCRIESFSLLSKALQKPGVDKYESRDFEAGGYKWRLVLYPNGNTKRDANDHISLYLAISETNKLPCGWEVHAFFKFLVFDQIRDKYLVVQDVGERRFHAMKTEWGIPKLLTLSTFNDPAFGYLIDDCCVFGVDVIVCKWDGIGKGETLCMIKKPENGTFTWKVDKFSKLKDEYYRSEAFSVGGRQWKILLYPKGDSTGKGTHLSLYLCVFDFTVLHLGWKLYDEFKLSIKDQVHGKHFELTADKWRDASSVNYGWPEFKSLRDLNDANNGFIVKDTLIVEAQITLVSAINYFA